MTKQSSIYTIKTYHFRCTYNPLLTFRFTRVFLVNTLQSMGGGMLLETHAKVN